MPVALRPLPISCLPFLVPTAAAPVPAATVSGKILPASVPSAAAAAVDPSPNTPVVAIPNFDEVPNSKESFNSSICSFGKPAFV